MNFKAVECAFPYTTPKEEIKNILNKTGLKQVKKNMTNIKRIVKIFIFSAQQKVYHESDMDDFFIHLYSPTKATLIKIFEKPS